MKNSIKKKLLSGVLAFAMLIQTGIPVFAQDMRTDVENGKDILFEDDFEAKEINPIWQFSQTGEFVLKSNEIGNQSFNIRGVPWDAKANINTGKAEWQNYSIQMDFKINEWIQHGTGMEPYDCVGVVGRTQGSGKVCLYYRRATKVLELNKFYGNAGHEIAKVPFDLTPGVSYKMKLDFDGNTISGYFVPQDKEFTEPAIKYVDDGNAGTVFTYGGAGVESGGCDVSIDNVKIIGIENKIPVESVSIDKSNLLLEKGKKSPLTASVFPATASDKALIWESDNKSVATVDEAGVITAVATGNANITVTARQNPAKYTSCAVEVYDVLPCSTFYYVSTTGSDENDGSETKPFATLQKARDTIRTLNGNIPDGGITVCLRGGEYYQEETFELTPADSGKAGRPIVYTSYPNEKAVITGGKEINGWKLADGSTANISEAARGNLYVADVEKGWRFHDLYVDDERQQVSRQIDTIAFRTWPQFSGEIGQPNTKYIDVDPKKGTKVRFNEGELTGLQGNTDIECNVMTCMFWNAIPVVTEINEAEGTAYLQSQMPTNLGSGTSFNSQQGGWYSILNDIKYLDQPGEWCINSQTGKVYYWPKDQNFTSQKIVAPKPYELIRFQGDDEDAGWKKQVEYVVLNNLTMECTDRLPENQFDKFDAVRNSENPDAAVFMQGAANCKIINSVIKHTGTYAITLNHYAQNNEIIRNDLGDLGSGGVQLLGYGAGTTDVNKSNKVMYNNIHDIGVAPYPHTAGVTVFGSGENTISYNYISNVPYAAITIVGVELASFNSDYDGSAADLFGKGGTQFGIRWKEMELHKPYTRAESKAFLHSRNNTVEYNIVNEYMLKLEDGGGLYSWGCGLGNKYINNTIYKSEKGMHWTFPLYMDDQVDKMTVSGNRIWSMEQGTVNKGDNTWSDNLFAWPGKPDGYDALNNYIISTTQDVVGGYKVDIPEKVQLQSPANLQTEVSLPVDFSWKSAKNASKYSLQISKDKDFSTIAIEKTITDTKLTVANLDWNTTYYWRVISRGVAESQNTSEIYSFTIKQQSPPTAPSNVKVVSDYDSVLLKWDMVFGADYEVYRKTASDTDFVKIADKITNQNYLDSSVIAETNYQYCIKARNTVGLSEASGLVDIKTNKTKVIFNDDFEKGASDKWISANGNKFDVYDGVHHIDGTGSVFYMNAGDSSMVDYSVEMNVNLKGLTVDAPDWTGFGPMVRMVSKGDFNQFAVRGKTNLYESIMCDDSRYWTTFDTISNVKFEKDVWHKLRTEVKGDMLRCYVDNQLMIERENSTYKPYGGFGFNFIYEIAEIDNFKVVAIDDTPIPPVDPANKADLEALVSYAKAQKELDEYKFVVPVVKSALDARILSAEAIIADVNATQANVDLAYSSLLDVVQMLSYTGDNTTLLEKYNVWKEFNPAMYTPESAKAMTDALAIVKPVIDNQNALQDEIDTALATLETAIKGMEFYTADKDALRAQIEKANKYNDNLANYIDNAGKTEFIAALAVANDVVAQDYPTQEAIDKACTRLRNAGWALREIPNKDKLQELLTQANAFDITGYTANSVKARAEAISYAQTVMADPMATQEDVNAAITGIKTTTANLVLVEDEKTDDKETTDTTKDETTDKAEDTKVPTTSDTTPLAVVFAVAMIGCACVVVRKKVTK